MNERLRQLLRPVAKRVMHSTLRPVGPARLLFGGLFRGQKIGREVYEWGWRALVATPTFLARCERHGDDISIDRIPYVTGDCRIELGSNIQISGKLNIRGSHGTLPLLRIGDGVFVGANTCFALRSGIDVGNFVAIGSFVFITDTEGHNRYSGDRKPAWETPPGPDDVAPVVIEDGVWIGNHAAILKGVRVGAGSIIGFGAVVRANVPPGSMVVGNPGRNVPIQLFHKEPQGAVRA